MRRSDKEIKSRQEIDAVIRGCHVCRLAFAVDGAAYVIPLSFGYDGRDLYFHTAREGKKIDCLRANPRVCFEFEHHLRLVTSAPDPCRWGFEFETVIGWGTMTELTDEEEKIRALHQIVAHYGGDPLAVEPRSPASLKVWHLTIESITGKRSPAGA